MDEFIIFLFFVYLVFMRVYCEIAKTKIAERINTEYNQGSYNDPYTYGEEYVYSSNNHEDYRETETEHQQNEAEEPKKTEVTFMYFNGCKTIAECRKRYLNLMKIYHPDTGSGDEELCKMINSEYDFIQQQLKSRDAA